MANTVDADAYNRAHAALLELKEIGPMLDSVRTCMSRVRVTLEERGLMQYEDSDPLYHQANQVDHEVSELLDMLMKEGVNVEPARFDPQTAETDLAEDR